MIHKILPVAHITFIDCLRNKALYGILFMGLVLFGINIIFTGMFSWDLAKVAIDMGLSTVSFAGLILIFFFSIQMMSNDMDKKTIYLILSRPVSKSEYIIGKFIGLSLVILISSLILGVCAAFSVWLSTTAVNLQLTEAFSWKLFSFSIALQTLSLLILLSLAFLWVMVSSHSFTALLLTLMTYFVGQNMENVKNIILSTKLMSPDSLSIKAISLASWILPNLSVFNIKAIIAHNLPFDASSMAAPVVYGISYIGICLCLSILVFKKREI